MDLGPHVIFVGPTSPKLVLPAAEVGDPGTSRTFVVAFCAVISDPSQLALHADERGVGFIASLFECVGENQPGCIILRGCNYRRNKGCTLVSGHQGTPNRSIIIHCLPSDAPNSTQPSHRQ